jgi:hypothetical protein
MTSTGMITLGKDAVLNVGKVTQTGTDDEAQTNTDGSEESDDETETTTDATYETLTLTAGSLDCGGTLTVGKNAAMTVTSNDVEMTFGENNTGKIKDYGTIGLIGEKYTDYLAGDQGTLAEFIDVQAGGVVGEYELPAAAPVTSGGSRSSASSSDSGGGGAVVLLLVGAAAAVVGGVIIAQRMGLFSEKIGGVVTDDLGNLLNGATVIVQQVIDGELTNVQMTNTDENGRYQLIKPEGEYAIIAQYVDPTTGQTRTAHVYPDAEEGAEKTEEAASSVIANANANAA